MADIKHQVGMKAPAEKVYKAITEEAGLKGWFSEHSTAEAKVDGKVNVSFFNNAMVFGFKVVELKEDNQVVWMVEGGPPDWTDTKITWSLMEKDGQTMLEFVHSGFDSTEGGFGMFNYNWGWYITSMKFYLEKGEGMPHTDADVM